MLPPQTFYHQSSHGADHSVMLQSLMSAGQLTTPDLTTPPVRLRTISQEDVPLVQAILVELENIKDDLSVASLNSQELTAMIKSWTVHTDPPTSFQFLVTVANKNVGLAGLGWIGSKTALITNGKPVQIGAVGVIINPDARGHGYGFETLRIVIDHGLRELKLDQIEVGTISRNTAMRRLMEDRFGMPATITEPDRFGNDLEWNITQSTWATWLTEHGEQRIA